MKKTPTLFDRDWTGDKSRVVPTVHKDCAWVLFGEGVATRKYDGSCCLVRRGKLFKRREIKMGQNVPSDFELADQDEETGKIIGWVPVGDGPGDKYHREAFTGHEADGTYELLGPKVQGNAENVAGRHYLMKHESAEQYTDVPRNFYALSVWLDGRDIEGLVFHHPDGRMAKIKMRDFGLKRSKK